MIRLTLPEIPLNRLYLIRHNANKGLTSRNTKWRLFATGCSLSAFWNDRHGELSYAVSTPLETGLVKHSFY